MSLALLVAVVAEGPAVSLVTQGIAFGAVLLCLPGSVIDAVGTGAHRVPVPTEIALDAMVRSSVHDVRPLLADREVRLELAPMTVLADETLLGRVLTNLVSNVASHHVASVEVEDESGRRSPRQAASLALSIWADTYERGRRR